MTMIRKITACILMLTMVLGLTACNKDDTEKGGTQPTVAAKSDLQAAQELVESVIPASEFADKQVSLDSETVQTVMYTSPDDYKNDVKAMVRLADKTDVTVFRTTVQQLFDGGWQSKDAGAEKVEGFGSSSADFTADGKTVTVDYGNHAEEKASASACTVDGVHLFFGRADYKNPSDFLYAGTVSSKTSFQELVKALGRPKTISVVSDSGKTDIAVSYVSAAGDSAEADSYKMFNVGFSFDLEPDSGKTTMSSFSIFG